MTELSSSKTELDFGAIAQRDAKTAATWFTGPASGPADAYRDRRALIEAYAALRASVETSAPHRCRAMDLAEELRRYFDSGTLDEASDLYLLLKEVEAMRPEEPSAPPCTCHLNPDLCLDHQS